MVVIVAGSSLIFWNLVAIKLLWEDEEDTREYSIWGIQNKLF